jgi:hypothetical protein
MAKEITKKAGVGGNSVAGKSFQIFTVSEELLQKVVEAVQAGEKEARSSGNVQSFEVFCHGFRQNISLGRIMVVPAKVCNDRQNFPTALLHGALVRVFGTGGEEVADLIEKKIGAGEFDEYSQADFDTIKKELFTDAKTGEEASLVVFAPNWMNSREYVCFHFSDNAEQLKNDLRHLVFSAYYNPAVSSAFNALMTNVDTTKVDVTDITPKLSYPFLSENPLKQFPQLEKSAGWKRATVLLNRKTADEIAKQTLDPQELDVFDSLNQALEQSLLPSADGAQGEGGFKAPEAKPGVPREASSKEANGEPLRFFQESNGDYLAIDPDSLSYYQKNFGEDQYEGRGTAIAGSVSSVQTTAISEEFLKGCQEVPRDQVPAEWLRAIEGDEPTVAHEASEAFGGKQAPPFGSKEKDKKESSAKKAKKEKGQKCPECGSDTEVEKVFVAGQPIKREACTNKKCGYSKSKADSEKVAHIGADGVCPGCKKAGGECSCENCTCKAASLKKVAYVSHCPGHRNSKGEKAEWCIKQHETGKILESFKSEDAAKEGLRNMESHKGSAEKKAYSGDPRWLEAKQPSRCKKCGRDINAGERVYYYPKTKTVYCDGEDCGKQAARDFEAAAFDERQMTGSAKEACAPHETPFTNVGPGTEAHAEQEASAPAMKESVQGDEGREDESTGGPIGIAIDETGVPRRKEEEAKVGSKGKKADHWGHCKQCEATVEPGANFCSNECRDKYNEENPGYDPNMPAHRTDGLIDRIKGYADQGGFLASDKNAASSDPRRKEEEGKTAKIVKTPHPEKEGFDNRGKQIEPPINANLTDHYAKMYSGGFVDKRNAPPKEVAAYITATTQPDSQSPSAVADHAKEIKAGGYGKYPLDKSAAGDNSFSKKAEEKWGSVEIPLKFKRGAVNRDILNDFERGYIEAALWSTNDGSDPSGGEPLDRNYDIEDISDEGMQQIRKDCADFQKKAAPLLQEAYQRPGYDRPGEWSGQAMAGHDFWLTRCGHGVGFWDREALKEGGLGDRLSEVARSFGESDLYIGDDHMVHVASAKSKSFSPAYVANKLAKIVDSDGGYEAISTRGKQARAEKESLLDRFRPKTAVELDIDSIWDAITEDMGPAPLVDVDTDPSNSAPSNTEGESQSTEPRSSARPNKRDVGDLPEAFRSPEPEDKKEVSEGDAEREESGLENEATKQSAWRIDSKFADFVDEVSGEIEDSGRRVSCDQCEMAAINGVPCHEHGCPNANARWDEESGRWVRQRKCRECGFDVDEDDPCCSAESDEIQHECMASKTAAASEGLKKKLFPGRFSDMSGKMAAIVGYILGETYTNPSITDMAITSDGFVMAQQSGDIGMNDMIGDVSDLRRNWDNLLSAAGLEPQEKQEAAALFKRIRSYQHEASAKTAEPRLKCPHCGAASGRCPECNRRYPHGTASHCTNPSCQAVNAPIDCVGCGRIISKNKDGIIDADGEFHPFALARDKNLRRSFPRVSGETGESQEKEASAKVADTADNEHDIDAASDPTSEETGPSGTVECHKDTDAERSKGTDRPRPEAGADIKQAAPKGKGWSPRTNSEGFLVDEEDDEEEGDDNSLPTQFSMARIHNALERAGFREDESGDLVHPVYGLFEDQSSSNGYLISLGGKTFMTYKPLMAMIEKMIAQQAKKAPKKPLRRKRSDTADNPANWRGGEGVIQPKTDADVEDTSGPDAPPQGQKKADAAGSVLRPMTTEEAGKALRSVREYGTAGLDDRMESKPEHAQGKDKTSAIEAIPSVEDMEEAIRNERRADAPPNDGKAQPANAKKADTADNPYNMENDGKGAPENKKVVEKRDTSGPTPSNTKSANQNTGVKQMVGEKHDHGIEGDIAQAKSESTSPNAVDKDIPQPTVSVLDAGRRKASHDVHGKRFQVIVRNPVHNSGKEFVFDSFDTNEEADHLARAMMGDLPHLSVRVQDSQPNDVEKVADDISGDMGEAKSGLDYDKAGVAGEPMATQTESAEQAGRKNSAVKQIVGPKHDGGVEGDLAEADAGVDFDKAAIAGEPAAEDTVNPEHFASKDKTACGEDQSESVEFDFGAGDLADIVLVEDEEEK